MLVETESLSWRVWRWFSPGLLELTAWTKISWCALTFKLKSCNSLRRSPIYFGIKSLQILQNLEHSSHGNWQRLCSENCITWSPPFFFWRSHNSSKISLLKIGSRLSMIGSNQSELEGQYSSYVLAFPLFYSNALFKIYTLSVVTICCKIEMGHLKKRFSDKK